MMIPSRRSFLKFLAAAAAVPTLPAIGQKVEPDLDSYGVWLGLETSTIEWKTCGYVEHLREVTGRGYERHFIPARNWKQVEREHSIEMLWPQGHTFFAEDDWSRADYVTLFRKDHPIWRTPILNGPYRLVHGDTLRVEDIRITSDWSGGHGGKWTDEAMVTMFERLLPGIKIRR